MREPLVAVKLRLAAPFRDAIGGANEATFEARDVRDMFERVEKKHPGFKSVVFDADGKNREDVFVYVNGRDVRSLDGRDTRLAEGDVVAILNAISGGRR